MTQTTNYLLATAILIGAVALAIFVVWAIKAWPLYFLGALVAVAIPTLIYGIAQLIGDLRS